MWTIAGLILALLGATLATARGRTARSGSFESAMYEMTNASHRRFAIVSLAFAGFFALAIALPVLPSFPILAAYVVFFILYASSFIRGATGEDE